MRRMFARRLLPRIFSTSVFLTRALCIAALVTQAAQANSASVWKVSHGDHHLFLGGTIHVLSAEDYPLPAPYHIAYEQAQTLVFETDMQAVASVQFQQTFLQTLSYQDGTQINQVLNTETLKALNHHLQKRNIPFANIQHFKPSMLSLVLSMTELQLAGLNQEGVDAYFFAKAGSDNKTRKWLETPAQQLAFIADMDNEDPNDLILYTLKDLQTLPTTLGKLRTAWQQGDMTSLAQVSIQPFKQDYPSIYQSLIIDRNQNWLPHIEKMLTDKAVEFVLVGAMHLAGDDSVIASLEQKGYKIEQVTQAKD